MVFLVAVAAPIAGFEHRFTMPQPTQTFAPAARSLRAAGRFLWRRRWTVASTFTVFVLLGGLAALVLPARWRATVRVLVEPPAAGLDAHVRDLNSDALKAKVAARIGVPPRALPGIEVGTVKNTDFIEVSAEGTNRTRVAEAPDLLVRTYLDDTRKAQSEKIRDVFAQEARQVDHARERLKEADAALQDFKQKHRDVAVLENSRDAQLKEFEALRTQADQIALTLASNRAEIAASQKQARPAFATITAEPGDATRRDLEEQLADLEAIRARLGERYRPTSSRIEPLNAQIAAYRVRLAHHRGAAATASLPDQSAAAPAARAAALADKAVVLDKRVRAARARLGSYTNQEMQLARLRRERDAAKANYDTLSERADRLRAEVRRGNVRVSDTAMSTREPANARKGLLILAGLLGLAAGGLFAWLRERFDGSLHGPDETNRLLRLPVVGQIPVFAAAPNTKEPLAGPAGEAYQALAAHLDRASRENGVPLRTIVVTSAGPEEGRSTTIANLAVVLAQSGRGVLVVDADLRRPTQHQRFDVPAAPGLVDYLTGSSTLADVVRTTSGGVRIVSAGSYTPNPAALLRSEGMDRFFEAVRKTVDLVLVDTPPLVGVGDASVLVTRVDGTLFLVGGGAKKPALIEALDLLNRAKGLVVGTVYNKMAPAVATGKTKNKAAVATSASPALRDEGTGEPTVLRPEVAAAIDAVSAAPPPACDEDLDEAREEPRTNLRLVRSDHADEHGEAVSAPVPFASPSATNEPLIDEPFLAGAVAGMFAPRATEGGGARRAHPARDRGRRERRSGRREW